MVIFLPKKPGMFNMLKGPFRQFSGRGEAAIYGFFGAGLAWPKTGFLSIFGRVWLT
jgi:hypothetical protein